MSALVRVVVGAVLLLFVVPQPAHAIWRFLEHMSGPGWYDGVHFEWKLICRPITEANEVDILNLGISLPCRKRNDQEQSNLLPRKHTLGVSGGLMWSTINRLKYDPSIRPEDTQVWIATTGAFYDYRLPGFLERVELGSSAEFLLLFGKASKTLPRAAFEPRATVRLGTVYRDLKPQRRPIVSLKLRAGILWLPQGFKPGDFGELVDDGPQVMEGDEILTSVKIILDFDCWPWKSGC